jgi:predicted transcriptional regulator
MPIEEQFALQILTGRKRYEIRKRQLHFPDDTRIWLYATKKSRQEGTGAVLGSFTFGGCVAVNSARELRDIAEGAASTYGSLRKYLGGNHGWAIKVASYERLKQPVLVTLRGVQSIQRLTDRRLLARLHAAEKYRPRRPLGRAALLLLARARELT